MLIILHISVALISLLSAGLLLCRRSQFLCRLAYASVTLTIISGLIIGWLDKTHLLQTCVSGLIYLVAVTAILATARYQAHRT